MLHCLDYNATHTRDQEDGLNDNRSTKQATELPTGDSQDRHCLLYTSDAADE